MTSIGLCLGGVRHLKVPKSFRGDLNLGDFSAPYHLSSFSLRESRGFFHSSCSGRFLKPLECLVSLSFPEKPRVCDRKWERMTFSYPWKTASLTKSYQVLIGEGYPENATGSG